jgi:cobalt transporter subunit CbtB
MTVTSKDPRVVAGLTASMGGLWPALAAALLGLTIVYGVAVANSDTIHNAAHDTRHAAAFPCH